MDYEQLPRAALVRMLQEHDAALVDAGKNGIVMNYTGRTAPWQIIRQVKPKLFSIIKKYSCGVLYIIFSLPCLYILLMLGQYYLLKLEELHSQPA